MWRVISSGMVLLGLVAAAAPAQAQDQGFSVYRQDHLFWDAFARYDSGWYHGIASQGYIYGAGGRNKRDRDAPVLATGFAATRFPLSMDSR